MWAHTWLQALSWRGSLALPWHHQTCELQVFYVVQLVAWRPAPGFCSDPSNPSASSLEELGNCCLSYNCTFQQLNLSSNTEPKCCCCWQEVCVFGAELVFTEGQMSKGFYPASMGPVQFLIAGAVWKVWRHCCTTSGRGLAAAGKREAGCNPWQGRQEGNCKPKYTPCSCWGWTNLCYLQQQGSVRRYCQVSIRDAVPLHSLSKSDSGW